jgi:hypothetical protein
LEEAADSGLEAAADLGWAEREMGWVAAAGQGWAEAADVGSGSAEGAAAG